MFGIWYDGKYIDTWYNTMDDYGWIETTIEAMGWDPLLTKVMDYSLNINGHTPRRIKTSVDPVMWISNEKYSFVETTGMTEVELGDAYREYRNYMVMRRVIDAQMQLLDNAAVDYTKPAVPAPPAFAESTETIYEDWQQFVGETIYENGILLREYTSEARA